MKTPQEHDAERYAELNILSSGRNVGANVACPKCGYEMFFTNSGSVLACWPPRRDVECGNPACRHQTMIVA